MCVVMSHTLETLQKLVPGVLILGAVLEIHEYEVLVSLPFNMRGSVAIADVSDHMTKLVESEAERLDTEDEEVSERDCREFSAEEYWCWSH